MFGLGLRHKHHKYVLKNKPKIDFFEIHSENFISDGGATYDFLKKIAKNYKLSFHCIGLSLGSTKKIDEKHLKNIKKLNDDFSPFLISDHLSFSSAENGTSNDLLPIPYNDEALEVFYRNIDYVQNYLGRQILIENPSAYLEFKDSKMSEVDFLNKLAQKANCKILLDLNNIFVSSFNFDYDAKKYIDEIAIEKVAQIHLAGHSTYEIDNKKVKIDTHSNEICQQVLEIYQYFVEKYQKNIPTMVEWDEDIPEFEKLESEILKVKEIYEKSVANSK